MHWHRWGMWTLKTRQMIIASPGLFGRVEEIGKEITEEYQERVCSTCGLTQRKGITA